MLDMTRTWNQNLWNAQKAIPTLSGSTSTPATQMPAAPMTGQYPLEATDFLSMPFRILPDHLVAGNAPLQQKQYMHMLYTQFLTEFDGQYRRSNIAVAVAYAISVSLRVDRGRQLSVPEWNQLVFRLNDALAMTPQFNALTPQQKQILYESVIITAASASVLDMQGRQQNEMALQVQARELAQAVLKQWAGI